MQELTFDEIDAVSGGDVDPQTLVDVGVGAAIGAAVGSLGGPAGVVGGAIIGGTAGYIYNKYYR